MADAGEVIATRQGHRLGAGDGVGQSLWRAGELVAGAVVVGVDLLAGEVTRTYEYDGLFRRLRTSDTLFFWSDTWQLIAKRPADMSFPKFEYIRGTIGIGEVIFIRKFS